jgi:hypothetical protein
MGIWLRAKFPFFVFWARATQMWFTEPAAAPS